jgi:hypothetical protein
MLSRAAALSASTSIVPLPASLILLRASNTGCGHESPRASIRSAMGFSLKISNQTIGLISSNPESLFPNP